jgi:hypothetical protein
MAKTTRDMAECSVAVGQRQVPRGPASPAAVCPNIIPCFCFTPVTLTARKIQFKVAMMEKELTDRAEVIQQRIVQLRDSL